MRHKHIMIKRKDKYTTFKGGAFVLYSNITIVQRGEP